MKRFLSEQLGKILLGAAFFVGLLVSLSNLSRPPGIQDDATEDCARKMQVAFQPTELAQREALFAQWRGEGYRGPDRRIGPVEKKAPPKPFERLNLPEVIRANVAPPPMLLPTPGPTLQGAGKLPRWGSELPPVYVPPAPEPPKRLGVEPPKPPAPPPPPPLAPGKPAPSGTGDAGKKG